MHNLPIHPNSSYLAWISFQLYNSWKLQPYVIFNTNSFTNQQLNNSSNFSINEILCHFNIACQFLNNVQKYQGPLRPNNYGHRLQITCPCPLWVRIPQGSSDSLMWKKIPSELTEIVGFTQEPARECIKARRWHLTPSGWKKLESWCETNKKTSARVTHLLLAHSKTKSKLS
jgi:hypothetical protein